ncbi:hypothetical protein CP10743SC13_2150, partial [Chlamydia psittaci 10_743_SC13]
RIFSLQIPQLTQKTTSFLFENPTFKRKSHVFSLQIPHLT